jgi:hypothetical protein
MGWGFGMQVTGYKTQFFKQKSRRIYTCSFTGVFDFTKYLNDPFEKQVLVLSNITRQGI